MGLAGMPGVWSRLMRVLFDKYPFFAVYLGDICVLSNLWMSISITSRSYSKFFARKSYLLTGINASLACAR